MRLSITVSYAALVYVFLAAIVPCVGQDSRSIKMTVSKSNSLPLMDSSLAPGSLFDRGKARRLIGEVEIGNNWHKFPAAMGNVWQVTEKVIIRSRDEKLGKEDSGDHTRAYTVHFPEIYFAGHYVDRTGQMWEYDEPGFWIENHDDKCIHHIYVMKRELTAMTDSDWNLSQQTIDFQVDKTTGRIIDVAQKTLISSHRPLSGLNSSRTHCSAKTFDWHGNLTNIDEWQTDLKNLGAIAPKRDLTLPDGRSLYPLFISFLKENGMSDRVPND